MIQRLIPLLIISLLAAACNLGTEATSVIMITEETPIVSAQNTATPTATAIATRSIPTRTPPATAIAPPVECDIVPDWPYVYVVEAGDTLFSIAQTINRTVDELATGNCLADANTLEVGQELFLPVPIDGTPTHRMDLGYPLEAYLIVVGDEGRTGPAVACGDSALLTAISQDPGGDIETNLSRMLTGLFTHDTGNNGSQAGFYNALAGKGLTVASVDVDNGRADIIINGNLFLVGVCEDARMEAQLLLTIFAYPQIEQAYVIIGGINMKQIFDSRGIVGDTEPYTKAEAVALRGY